MTFYSNPKIDGYENKYWYQGSKLHRLDGPAVEMADGRKFWYQNGKLHRLDGPAGEYPNGDKIWFQNNHLHRLDGPAIEYVNGYKEWRLNDQRYESEEEWFLHLPQEDKLKMLWRLGE